MKRTIITIATVLFATAAWASSGECHEYRDGFFDSDGNAIVTFARPSNFVWGVFTEPTSGAGSISVQFPPECDSEGCHYAVSGFPNHIFRAFSIYELSAKTGCN